MVPCENAKSVAGFDRRDFIIGAAGVAALGAGLGNAETALAQAGPGPASAPPSAAPGRVVVERRGPVLLIGIDRPQAQNRLDAPIIIGLGRPIISSITTTNCGSAYCTASVPISAWGSMYRPSPPLRQRESCRRKTLSTSARSV